MLKLFNPSTICVFVEVFGQKNDFMNKIQKML